VSLRPWRPSGTRQGKHSARKALRIMLVTGVPAALLLTLAGSLRPTGFLTPANAPPFVPLVFFFSILFFCIRAAARAMRVMRPRRDHLSMLLCWRAPLS
jgi:hypothetical protein